MVSMSICQEYEKRKLKPYHILIATSLALFRRYGALNFGVVNVAMEETGRKLAQLALKERGEEIRGRDIPGLVSLLNEMLGMNSELEAELTGDTLTVKSRTSLCKLCPKGVGGLELPGRLCPYVGLIRGFVEEIANLSLDVDFNGEFFKKEGGYCVIKYKVGARR